MPVTPSSRQSALEAWLAFLPQTPAYGSRRNFVTPGHGEVSRLSGPLRARLILEHEIVEETLAAYPLQRVECWVREVCWRRYWKAWLEQRPAVWRDYREGLRALQSEGSQMERARAVMEGQSGVALMDAFARELTQTGYLHNHARMWWASFWIHFERLPWQLGADFFFRNLLDADAASNTLSWRWVAGIQSPGKTYLVRRSNLEQCCEASFLSEHRAGIERLDDAVVSAVALAETADLSLHDPPDFPLPDALAAPFGLWLHADDGCAELGPLSALCPAGIAAFFTPHAYAHYALSPARIEYLRATLTDSVSRAGAHFGVPGRLIQSPGLLSEALAAWAHSEGLRAVVALAPFVGPVNDAIPAIRAALSSAGCRLHLVRRECDSALFPLARAGFFPFWKKLRSRVLTGARPA